MIHYGDFFALTSGTAPPSMNNLFGMIETPPRRVGYWDGTVALPHR